VQRVQVRCSFQHFAYEPFLKNPCTDILFACIGRICC
jgi:hypothetical protein